eukprot:1181397-Amphidinium_carterae.1
MNQSSRSVESINIANIQDEYTREDVNRLHLRFLTIPAEDEEEYDQHNEMTVNIRRRIMRQSNGFEVWRQLTLQKAGGHRAQPISLLRTIISPSWDSTTKQFTRQDYNYIWLEHVIRYESENGQGTITDHVKINTIITHLKGPIGQHLMLRVNNTTTFAEAKDNGQKDGQKKKAKTKTRAQGRKETTLTKVLERQRKTTNHLLHLRENWSLLNTMLPEHKRKRKQKSVISIHQQPSYQPEQHNGGKGKGAGKPSHNNCNHGYNYNNKGARKKGDYRPQVFNISDNYNQTWHQEPDNIQYQASNPTQQQPTPQLGTPSQPSQSQMGMLYNVGAVINSNQTSPTHKTQRLLGSHP